MRIQTNYDYAGEKGAVRVLSGTDETRFIALRDSCDAGYEVSWTINAPITGSYIMIPACAYNGNRFEAVRRRYAPMFKESEFGKHPPIRMTEVPRLSPEGDSFMDVTTGDMATPCVCVLNTQACEAFMVFFNQGAHGLNHGVSLDQTGDELRITLRAPARRRLVYRWYDGYPSLRENPEADAPLKVKAGDETVISHRVYTFPCSSIPELYRHFFEKRALLCSAESHACLPFSAYWDMAKDDLNRNRYNEKNRHYTLNNIREAEKNHFGCWQAGWVGGGMSTLPLIADGDDLSMQRAIETLEFAARYQSKAGFYYGIVDIDGNVRHDCFGRYEDRYNLVLIRKHGDLTYFMFKQIEYLRRMGRLVPESILSSAVSAADALVRLWKENGQLGQFINAETGEIIVGGSASGAIVPAALCAASHVTGNGGYHEIAMEIARYYYNTATLTGITTGGPGEILQAPDSESSAALLESYITLYEYDSGREWLMMAMDAAHQLASWVVSYDYEFPPESRFGRLGIKAAGSVWANVQNKHSAPGLCTLSAAGFLKLYRATGNVEYLRIMQQIAHFIPQTTSRPDRPVYTVPGDRLPDASICERVNLSDWEGNENVGDSIFGSSSWPEVSMMLTWLEVPGIYAAPERGVMCVSDHVNAEMAGDGIIIENPTEYPARVKVMAETANSMKESLGLYWQDRFRIVEVQPGKSAYVKF